MTSLCPEGENRARMSDPDFWAHVSANLTPSAVTLDDPGPDDDQTDPPAIDDGHPCPECGERGACGYDAEGRPMVHVIADEDA